MHFTNCEPSFSEFVQRGNFAASLIQSQKYAQISAALWVVHDPDSQKHEQMQKPLPGWDRLFVYNHYRKMIRQHNSVIIIKRGESRASVRYDKGGDCVLCKTCVKNTLKLMISCQSTIISVIIDPSVTENSSIKSSGNNSMITWALQWAWPHSAVGGLQHCRLMAAACNEMWKLSQNCDKDDS